ncbi:Panacea domain-containing protein [Psychrobacter sp. I-STPA10]|uniref:Panacea domain-containing protein n=1 Tax=Psychrobacter sp. I-STPA10 TaxID=2585769 RepID=UPI001E31A6DE|nr:type II toxin-antitoxin system antitoxin SocA domain-containing protein [Psychrobacter sp. I-STPA10]
MTTSAKNIANEFIKKSKEEHRELTNMQLQKLVYIANGFSLALLGKPLYYEDTFAWTYGPLIKPLYKSLMNYGSGYVTDYISTNPLDDSVDELEEDVINYVWTKYGGLTAFQLSRMTHQANTPWSITWDRQNFDIIDRQLIEDYYRGLVCNSLHN